jgi:hypothetical protein
MPSPLVQASAFLPLISRYRRGSGNDRPGYQQPFKSSWSAVRLCSAYEWIGSRKTGAACRVIVGDASYHHARQTTAHHRPDDEPRAQRFARSRFRQRDGERQHPLLPITWSLGYAEIGISDYCVYARG